MHLVHPSLSKLGKSKKKVSKTQEKAKADHEAWLRKNNIHVDQLSKTKRTVNKLPDLSERTPVKLSNGFAPGGLKSGIMENLHNETPEVRAAILEKARAIAPAYSKGPAQYLGTSKDAWRHAGKKNSE